MEEKKYLKWYNKVGYGCGDIGGNAIYAFLTSFVMIFLTDKVGLDPGIVGILMAVARVLDGISDICFGALIDRTKTKMGKARPWMFWGYFGNVITLIMIFAIPESLGDTAKYAYFFIAYTLLNAVFYTANNIAYSSLTALITRNNSERVQIGSIRFIFSFATSMVIQSVTVGAVAMMGNGAAAWRNIAIIYSVVGLLFNTISVMSVKELPEEKNIDHAVEENEAKEKGSLLQTAKLLIYNRFYLMIVALYILAQFYVAVCGMGIYYMTYILDNASLLGVFSWALNLPLMVGLIFTPFIVKRFNGMYKINLYSYVITIIFRIVMIIGGYMGNVPLMLFGLAVSSFGQGPMQGTLNALIAATSDYTYRVSGKRIDGLMYSCSSLGVKIGNGLGTALTGILLGASGYIANAAVQPASCINMLNFMYLWFPLIIFALQFIALYCLKVEKANRDWDMKHEKTEDIVR